MLPVIIMKQSHGFLSLDNPQFANQPMGQGSD